RRVQLGERRLGCAGLYPHVAQRFAGLVAGGLRRQLRRSWGLAVTARIEGPAVIRTAKPIADDDPGTQFAAPMRANVVEGPHLACQCAKEHKSLPAQGDANPLPPQ